MSILIRQELNKSNTNSDNISSSNKRKEGYNINDSSNDNNNNNDDNANNDDGYDKMNEYNKSNHANFLI